ncbi:MAG TPA: 16S rRNA (cytidine(1402)-2'-O)-methyltransferase [Gammaproteobacteria bacterium]|nr:16S rRNA (cytidine(1402)-2'-O)-methyltransferase [Gammaproteobacteria bacterium]
MLYVIATPIGNLADLGSRARDVLDAVDLVVAEDTRRAGRLLAHLGLKKKLVSLHEHNEDEQTPKLLAELERGRRLALISDAGTPLISDPGLKLVAGARARRLTVVGIPGASAVTAALSVAGLPTDRFVFEGFLPRRQKQRRARLEALAPESRTLVFFEAVHRIEATLDDMIEAFGPQRRAVLARELTKLHEQVLDGALGEIRAALGVGMPLLGEFVIVVAGTDESPRAGDDEVRHLYRLLVAEIAPSRAVALCARITGRSRNEVYALTRA